MPTNPNKLSQFWQELKRRRVIQVIVVYATAAFVILEAVDIIFPRLNFPDWTITFVMILLVIGFPIAIIFSWIFDYTPRGIEKTKTMEEIRFAEAIKEKVDVEIKQSILWSKVVPWSVTGLLTAMILLLWIFRWNNTSQEIPVLASVYTLPQDEVFKSDDPGAMLTFSPDGKTLIYSAYRNDTSFLYEKKIDEFGAEQIAGTERGYAPFYSPDGKWVGFFADGKLKKVSMLGGAPQVICETFPGYEGCWGEDDIIVFCDSKNRSLWQVSANGDGLIQLTSAMKWLNDEIENSHRWPSILPDGNALLYTIGHNAENMRIALYSFETGKTKTLIEPGSHAIYVQTGHLVYAWKGDLLAVPFDIKRMEVIGDPVMVLQNILMRGNGLAHLSISKQGSIAYLPGKYELLNDILLLVDHSGKYDFLVIPPGRYQNPSFSPDGKHLLITRFQEKANIWVYGLGRGTFRRFTEKDFESFWAIWTLDSKQIVFNSNRHGGDELNLFMKRLDSNDSLIQLTTSDYNQQPKSWSRDSINLVYLENVHTHTGYDINMIKLSGNDAPVQLLSTRFNETHPNLSHDGQWLAFVSDETGKDEVFICSFPDCGHFTQISTSGGTEPVWAPEDNKLYYRDYTGNKVMAVSIKTKPSLTPGMPSIMFEGKFNRGYPFGRNYDITPDGQRFLMIKEEEIETEATQINIIHNWSQELINMIDYKNRN